MSNFLLVSKSYKKIYSSPPPTPVGRLIIEYITLNIYAQGGKDSSCVREFFKDKMTCVCQVILAIYLSIYQSISLINSLMIN